jgi:peptide deformylase
MSSLENGWIHSHKKNKARTKCVCFSLGVVVMMCLGLVGIGEMYRIEMKNTISKITSTMHDRDSLCLSSIHIGHTEHKIIVLAALSEDAPQLVLMNPSIYSAFGTLVKTSELADPPTHCATQLKKAYIIERKRHESVSVMYVPVNTTDITWPLKSILHGKATKTFTGSRSFCIQHIMEVLEQANSCEKLDSYETVKRIEL